MTKLNKEIVNFQVETINDYESIKIIINDFNEVFTPALSERIDDLEAFAKKISNNANFLFVMENNVCIGLAVVYTNDSKDKIAYLSLIGIKPVAQNMRLGTLLLHDCIHRSKRLGMEKIKLEVISLNHKAIDFYKRHGFEVCGDASSASIYMIKEL